MTINNKQELVREFRFSLISEFAGEQVNMANKYIRPGKYPRSTIIKYPVVLNDYLSNEFKGFVQYLAIEKQLVSSSMVDLIRDGLTKIADFLNERYPELSSIIDIPFDKLYAGYLEFLVDNNFEIKEESVFHVDKNMKYKGYIASTSRVYALGQFYRFVYDYAVGSKIREYDKDVWDVRKLGIACSLAVSRMRYTVNFTSIHQLWLRDLIKKYVFYRLQNRKFSVICDDIKALKIFSMFLKENHEEIKSLVQLTRLVIEEYFRYLGLRGYCTTAYNRRVSVLKVFLSLGSMLEIGEFPAKPLIFCSDYRKQVTTVPMYYSDNEIGQINKYIQDLPIQIARIVFILENCGMRLSDILSSTILVDGEPCVKQSGQGGHIFTYYMPKTHRYNAIPVSDLVADIIRTAIAESKQKYGEDCKYIFSKSADEPISVETFSNWLNKLSYEHKLKKDDGNPLRITGHSFRRTVATKYANMGVDPKIICAMLGQRELGILKHYVAIHSSSMLEMMKPITDTDDKLIANIGNESDDYLEEIEEPSLVPLSNGRCAKAVASGICNHANMCYGCRMFIPQKECLGLYIAQLQEARNNIAIAKLHGFERVLEMNVVLEKQLENIITKIS